MKERLSFRFISNVYVSNPTNFKDRFFFTFNEEKHKTYLELYRQQIVSETMKTLMTNFNQKVPALLAPSIVYLREFEYQFTEMFWRNVLEKDLLLHNVTISCGGCIDCIIDQLFTNVWNQQTLEAIGSLVNECVSNGSPLDRDKVGLFAIMYNMGYRPIDFAITNFHDYQASWISLSSYVANAVFYSLLVFLDSYITLDKLNLQVPDAWYDIIKKMIASKFESNIYDEDSLKKFLIAKKIVASIQPYIRYLFDVLNPDDSWEYSYFAKIALHKTLIDLVNQVVNSSDIKSTIESFDFNTSFTNHYAKIKDEVEWQLKRFDKTKIQDYFNQVINESTEDKHIHPALYPVFQVICEGQDIHSKDDFGYSYNSLKAIQELSNFDNVNIDDYVLDSITHSYDMPNKDAWLSFIRNDLLNYVNNQLSKDIEKHQAEDWFFEIYNNVYKIVVDTLATSFTILTQPLISELRNKYNLSAIEELEQTINSAVYVVLYQHAQSSIPKITQAFLKAREGVDISHELDNLANGDSLHLTKILQETFSKAIDGYRRYIDLNEPKYEIKQSIANVLYNFAGNTQLLFDTLAGNLDFLQRFDHYYGQFENAFFNKLKYDLKKFYHQLEHAYIGHFYLKLVELDSISYVMFPVIDLYKEYKLMEYILIGTINLDTLRYHAINTTEFPIHLKTNYIMHNKLNEDMLHKEDYRRMMLSMIHT